MPALFVLAAVLARDAARSATWSALLSLGAAVKAFPIFLYPALLRGESGSGGSSSPERFRWSLARLPC